MEEKLSLGTQIRSLRDSQGKTQAEFAGLLGIHQGTLSAWERDDEARRPSADMLFRIASLCRDPEEARWFLKYAGLKPEAIVNVARRISKEFASEQAVEAPEGKVVAIKRLGGEPGSERYLDARLILDPMRVAYWDDADLNRHPLIPPTGKGGAVVVDTVAGFNETWDELVLIESLGPQNDNPGLPPYGPHLGYFSFDFEPASGLFLLEFVEYLPWRVFRSEGRPLSRRVRAAQRYRVGIYDPLTPEQKRTLHEGLPTTLEREVYSRVVREFPAPKHIRFLGRVITFLQPPDVQKGSENTEGE